MKKSLHDVLVQTQNRNVTLLGIGVMSKTVVDSALELCKKKNFPLLFIASRNQVEKEEFGGGYANNWNSLEFGKYVKKRTEQLNIGEFVYLCRDHGGPWQNDKEYLEKIDTEQAINYCLESYYEDLNAGYNLIHIDTSKDWNLQDKVPLDIAVNRTVYLVEKLEEYRKKQHFQPIIYEISLEQTGKNNCAIEEFEQYVKKMLEGFTEKKIIKPEFIVGDTGTYVRMDKNVGKFNRTSVRELCKIANQSNMFLKEHNADYLATDILAQHGELGINMANVAPEFARAETVALLELCKIEKSLLSQNSNIHYSGFEELLTTKVMNSNKWKKWIETDRVLDDKTDDKLFFNRAVEVCGHYFYSVPAVKEARKLLYRNIADFSKHNQPEKFVSDHVKASIERYLEAFHLEEFNLFLNETR